MRSCRSLTASFRTDPHGNPLNLIVAGFQRISFDWLEFLVNPNIGRQETSA